MNTLIIIVIYLSGYLLAYLYGRWEETHLWNLEYTKSSRMYNLFICLGSWATVVTYLIVHGIFTIDNIKDFDKPAKW